MSCLNDISCSYKPYFLDLENGKIRKNMSDFRFTSVKTIQNVSDIFSASWYCAAPLFIYASIRDSAKLSFYVNVETHVKIKVCVKIRHDAYADEC